MRHLYWLQVGLLLLIIFLAAVHSLLSLRLQSKEQHISISLQACSQAARLGRCAHEIRPQPMRLSYEMASPLITAASLSCLSTEPGQEELVEPFTLTDIVRDRPPQLEQVASFFSSKEARLQATLIVSFTVKRLAQNCASICANWPGPISAGVYLPVTAAADDLDPLESAREQLSDLHSRLEAEGDCQADIFLMSERLSDASLVDLFPINALRNVALLAARTELVFVGDGDFLISKALVEDLSSAAGYRKLHQLCEAGHYVVVPAFEVLLDKSVSAGRSSNEARLEVALRRARAVVTQSKLQLLKALPQGWLAPFGFWRNFTHGHGPTDFTRWASASAPYEAKYAWQYEPWGLMERHQTPLFDERFRGYGYNKAIFARWLAALGHKFMVHPSAFMVHQPHAESCAKGLWRSSMPDGLPERANPKIVVSADTSCVPSPNAHVFTETQRQGLKARAEIAEGIYKPVLSAMTKRCKATLPWC